MKSNLLATELETKLNKFWLDKLGKDDIYEQYAFLHKHEEGQIINTSLSKNASRIMSIRASKGDGRAVVFILNCEVISFGDVKFIKTIKPIEVDEEITCIYTIYDPTK